MLAEAFLRSGKVRDLFTLPDGRLALVASDRISAFDVILPSEIPDKGKVLTGLSRFWLGETRAIVRNHLLDIDPAVTGDAFAASSEEWRGRLMVCQPATVVPIEAVVRGYLSGSGWKEYREIGSVCGISLPAGLRESDRLPEPIFTPATKAPLGQHDQNLGFDAIVAHISLEMDTPTQAAGDLAAAIREASLRLYGYGSAVAARAGIVLADTKFEFGLPRSDRDGPDQVMLIDEVMTPDSSRFWDASTYAPGGPQASFDKQFVRDWLETQPWDKTDPGPALPDNVIAGTRARYVEAFERITGASFARYLRDDVIGPEAVRP